MIPRRLLAPLLALALLRPVPAPAETSDALSEPARWLQQYLRIDTTNPPGREHLAAAFLAGILHREGIATRLLVSPQRRTSLWARLASPKSGGRAIVLLHHMDVVPAGPGWTARPFSGEIRDGRLWGRGAVDDKSLGIAQLAAFLDLKRRGVPLERDVIYLGVADEENGGGQGVAWMMERHPELFRGVEGVVGEGGRSQLSGDGRILWWGIEVAQKRPLWLRVTTTGRGGHGSGLNPESANHQLVLALARLLQKPLRWRVTPPARAYAHAIAPLHDGLWRRVLSDIDNVVEPAGPKEFLLPGMANLFVDSVQVTVLDGGEKVNVIPETARALLDVRLLPDTDSEAFLAEIRKTLGDDCDVEVLVTSPPAKPSPVSGRVWTALSQALRASGPVVPTFVPGFTDSRFFRERGIPAYGITPFALAGEDLRGIHNPDERIPLAELYHGVERMRRAVALYAAPGASRK
ncbi:MAG TPA: M20/M25/M40 family metallo-hydrolase [Thermoanaerobaculia bacterium]|nr:M20/M25/M40 family metallo-hydrolase [Thermoanaerobaculia bacterium]